MARVVRKVRMKAGRSPATAAAERSGNAAIAKDAPNRLTGTLWKLWAKLIELTEPGSRLDASAVKYRNVSGCTG